jgi:hypothetical protein
MTDREKLVELLAQACEWGNRCIGCKNGLPIAATCKEERFGKAADHLLANGVAVQEWISVEDRLPEERQNVLVHYVDGWMPIAFLLGGKWYQSGGETSWLSVTHWMHLPEPPEEG